MSEQWMIALDTDSYAGNFERKLCAYATGFIGDCGVGRREQEQFEDDAADELIKESIVEEIDANILQVADEHGCFRPVSTAAHTSGIYGSVVIHFRHQPSQEIIDFIKTRSEEWLKKKKIKLLSARLIHERTEIFSEERPC